MTMKKDNSVSFYRTSDLALTCALCIVGFIAEDVEAIGPTRSVFVFKSSEELSTAIKRYWMSELRVEPQAYFNMLKVLKARLYQR